MLITIAGGAIALVILFVFVVVVGYATVMVQRKWGSKWLWVVWLAPPVMVTGLLLTQVDYTVYALLSRPVLEGASSIFVLISLFSGEVVWYTASRFGPGPPPVFVNYMPAGLLAGAHGLTGILGCYHKLLATYATALDAVPRDLNPYPSIPRAFRISLRSFLPSATRGAAERSRQRGTVPSILGFDLAGAEAVLAELETLPPAQLSAIEACHQINVRRLRQRSILSWDWRGKLAGLAAAITVLISAAEYVGVLKLKDLDLRSLIDGISMTGLDIRSIVARGVSGFFVMLLMLFVINGSRFLPIRQRLQAFEDILTVAKAYRKGQAETPKGAAQKATNGDLERLQKERAHGP